MCSGERMTSRVIYALILVTPLLCHCRSEHAQMTAGLGHRQVPATDCWIAFASKRDGNSEIYKIRADGTQLTRLTKSAAEDTFPAWSPDGSRIAFVSDRDGAANLYAMASDGTDMTRLTSFETEKVSMPCWSPDGQRIAFVLQSHGLEIYVVRPDGSGVQALSDGMTPAWSPDGTTIAFCRHNIPRIYLMDADGSNVRPLLQNPGLLPDLGPLWSPDGQSLLYTSVKGTRNYEIYTVSRDGKSRRRLTNTATSEYAYGWSPDGARIVFGSDQDGNFELYIMDSDGSHVRRLTSHPADDLTASWSPRDDERRGE